MKGGRAEHYIFGRAIPRDQPFYEYAGKWYRIKKEPFISNASRSYYKTCFVKHLLPQFGMQHMKAISAAQIQEFVNGLCGGQQVPNQQRHRNPEGDLRFGLCGRGDRARSHGRAHPPRASKGTGAGR